MEFIVRRHAFMGICRPAFPFTVIADAGIEEATNILTLARHHSSVASETSKSLSRCRIVGLEEMAICSGDEIGVGNSELMATEGAAANAIAKIVNIRGIGQRI